MISIEGITLNPSPQFSISPEYFYYGADVVGGVLVLNIDGTYYANNIGDYTDSMNNMLQLLYSCKKVDFDSSCVAAISDVDGSIGFVTDVRITPGSSVLNFNYNIVIEFAKNKNKNIIINKSNKISSIFNSLNTGIIVKSYSESVSSDYSGTNLFAVNQSGNLTKTPAKMSISLEISVYNSDRCDTANIDFKTEIRNFLKARIDALSSNPALLKINIPANFVVCGNNSKLSISEMGGSATFELYIVPTGSLAVVDFSEKQDTNQITRQKKLSIRGSITGLDSSKQYNAPSGNGMSNARAVFDRLKVQSLSGDANILDGSCGTITPLTLDTCYIMSNSRATENTNNNKIDFEIDYEDVEKCIKQGYRIETEYEETRPSQQFAEFIIPGRNNSLVYYSKAKSAEKRKLTVKSSYESCNESFLNQIKTAVNTEFTQQKTNYGLSAGNFIVISKSEETGRYSYAKTEEYIECS